MRTWIDIVENGSYVAEMLVEYNLPRDATLDAELTSMGDEICEMANLAPERTGLDAGVIFISTQMGSHAARVKFFVQPGRNQPSFSVSIGNKPKVLANSLPEKVMRKFAPRVIEWVALNHVALQQFWDAGDTWTHDQVQTFISALRRL